MVTLLHKRPCSQGLNAYEVTLPPGSHKNPSKTEVDDKAWERLQKSPAVIGMLEDGVLEVKSAAPAKTDASVRKEEAKGDADVVKTSGGDDAKGAPKTDPKDPPKTEGAKPQFGNGGGRGR